MSAPQERNLRRTVQQIVDAVPLLPFLDDPAPQMVEQLPDVLKFLDALIPDPDQVIEVPKILPEDVPMRAVLRDAQLIEQLVEVATIVSYASLLFLQVMQRIAEQNVDIPVVGCSGAVGGLSGFLPGQCYSTTAEQIVDNPVPRPGGAGGLQGLHLGQSSTAFLEQIAEFPDAGGGLQDFSQSRVPQRLLRFLLDKLVMGFFHFSQPEKSAKIPRTQGRNWVRSRPHGRRELSWGLFGGITWGAASSPCC